MKFDDAEIFASFAEATGYMPARPVRVSKQYYKDDHDFIELTRLQKQARSRVYYRRNKLNLLAKGRVHRAKNRDYYREKSRRWRADPANKAKALAATKRWKDRNRERIRAKERARKRRQTEQRKAYKKAYYKKNRDRINANQRKRRKEKRDAKRKI